MIISPVLFALWLILFLACYPFSQAGAGDGERSSDPCLVEHPLKAIHQYTPHVHCPNCGMNRNMWARTRYVFHNSEGTHYACSLHCLADIMARAGEPPKDVRVAVYLAPEKMIPAKHAYFVVGSKARGTMTMVSKPAFASKAEAQRFAAQCGGKVVPFPQALAVAKKALPKARKMIFAKRQNKGKIALPSAEEQCAVCGMYPARYPDARAQVLGKDKKRYHFCSTQCLFRALAEGQVKPMAVWVTLKNSGRCDYAGSAYYVVGSREYGPMGPEAFPFETKQAAQAFALQHGGKLLRFGEVTYEEIMGK